MGQVFVSNTYPESYFDAATEANDKTDLKTKSNYWMSKPRSKNSGVTERLTYYFADRSPISAISFDLLSVGAEYQFWYYDFDGNKLPLLRDDYNQIRFTVKSRDDWQKWVHWSFNCIQCVAMRLEVDMTRVNDEKAPDEEYSLGMKRLAIKRAIANRSDAAIGLRPSVDILGNTVSKTVKDWSPEQAIDGSSDTFWKSEAQISQDAVVCMYLDIRDDYGEAQYIDSLNIDPVYSGSLMNIYYSTDDSNGERLPAFGVYESLSTDLSWDDGKGLRFNRDTSWMTFDTTKTQIENDGSWMFGIDWWPVSGLSGVDRTLVDIGDLMRIKAVNDSIELWYYIDGGLHRLSCPLPAQIRYNRSPIASERIDTEVIVEAGIQRDTEEIVRLRVRVINTYNLSGRVEEDASEERYELVSRQISELRDGVPDNYSLPLTSDVKVIQKDKEIVIPPNSSYEIPVIDISNEEPMNPVYDINVKVDYYTDPEYVENGRMVVSSKSDQGSVTWWRGDPDKSPSSLSVNDVIVATNMFLNPNLSGAGAWQPEQVDNDGDARLENNRLFIHGRTKVRNLVHPEYTLLPNRRYVFSAIPYFSDGTHFYKSYKLFVYDGKAESFLAIPALEVKSGERCEIRFTTPSVTSLLSFGFVGGSSDDDVVSWEKPIICRATEWDEMRRLGVDWFTGSSQFDVDAVDIPRFNEELNLNPKNDTNLELLGDVVFPKWASQRPFIGDIIYIKPGDNRYSSVPAYIYLKGGDTLVFSFYAKSESGFSKIQPFIQDGKGDQYWCDRYEDKLVDFGWHMIYARVPIPKGHAAEMMSFGLRENSAELHTVVGDLHVYNNNIAFRQSKSYVTTSMVSTVNSGNERFVRIDNMSNYGSIHISKVSIEMSKGRLSDITGSTVTVRQLDGDLSALVMKQEAMPRSMGSDKFLRNPSRYVSPDSYDHSSTLNHSLVYGRFKDEEVLRGGVADSIYDSKTWYPALVSQKLRRGTYTLSRPVSAKYIKLEFSQLTAVQYPIENEEAVMEYRVYPLDLSREMLRRAQLDQSLQNGKTDASSDEASQLLSASARQMFQSIGSNSSSVVQSGMDQLYQTPDVEITQVKVPQDYAPNGQSGVANDLTVEVTSSAVYTGQVDSSSKISNSSARTAKELLNIENARQAIYTAENNESLIALARRFGLTDWKLLMDANMFLDDTPTRQTIPGRVPGYWIMPGQQVIIPTQVMRQILSSSKVDVVRRSSTQAALTAISDVRPATPDTTVIGPKFFSSGSIHYYETRRAKRTQSVAYVVGIREISCRIVNLLSERDDRAIDFYSMAMPIWHLDHAQLTDTEIMVPDFSQDGAEVATAETDLIAFQSFYRCIKVISTNRDSLVNRRYFGFEDTPWHGPEYWPEHPELDCVWDDSTPDDPKVEEDNGGAWNSRRFSWSESWVNPDVPGKQETIWYDGELVKHITLGPEDRRFDAYGNQVPYTFKLGETHIPTNAYTTIGAMLFSLKTANPDHPDQTVDTRIQLLSGQYMNKYLIDENVFFDDRIHNTWQSVQSSRYALKDMNWACQVFLTFNNWERLDIYIKSGYIETGTTRVLAKNVDSPGDSDYEDITPIIGRKDSIYSFRQTGHHLKIKIEMMDPQDWFGSMTVIPMFIPQEDAVFLESDLIKKIEIMMLDGSEAPHTLTMDQTMQLGALVTYVSGRTSGPTNEGFEWKSSHTGIITVDPKGLVTPVTVMGTAYVTATRSGVTSDPFEITTTVHP